MILRDRLRRSKGRNRLKVSKARLASPSRDEADAAQYFPEATNIVPEIDEALA